MRKCMHTAAQWCGDCVCTQCTVHTLLAHSSVLYWCVCTESWAVHVCDHKAGTQELQGREDIKVMLTFITLYHYHVSQLCDTSVSQAHVFVPHYCCTSILQYTLTHLCLHVLCYYTLDQCRGEAEQQDDEDTSIKLLTERSGKAIGAAE
jgi:hypothetical protein